MLLYFVYKELGAIQGGIVRQVVDIDGSELSEVFGPEGHRLLCFADGCATIELNPSSGTKAEVRWLVRPVGCLQFYACTGGPPMDFMREKVVAALSSIVPDGKQITAAGKFQTQTFSRRHQFKPGDVFGVNWGQATDSQTITAQTAQKVREMVEENQSREKERSGILSEQFKARTTTPTKSAFKVVTELGKLPVPEQCLLLEVEEPDLVDEVKKFTDWLVLTESSGRWSNLKEAADQYSLDC